MVPMNFQQCWKAKLERAHFFKVQFDRITVCGCSLLLLQQRICSTFSLYDSFGCWLLGQKTVDFLDRSENLIRQVFESPISVCSEQLLSQSVSAFRISVCILIQKSLLALSKSRCLFRTNIGWQLFQFFKKPLNKEEIG